jgi:hypothetical protein
MSNITDVANGFLSLNPAPFQFVQYYQKVAVASSATLSGLIV